MRGLVGARTTRFVLAAAIVSVAAATGAAQADDLQVSTAKSSAAKSSTAKSSTAMPEELRAQTKALEKRIEQLERQLRQVQAMTAHPPVQPAPVVAPVNPPWKILDKAPPPPSAPSDSLTWRGLTLYGSIDMGLGYQTHGAPLSNSAGFGLDYLIAKNSNQRYFGVAPNGFGGSYVGLKGDEPLFPGLSGVFNLQTSFLPTSGRLADGLGSVVQNNGVPVTAQTTFADSSKDGQALNTLAYGGLSSKTYGTLTYGRQNALTLDGVIAYDPMGASGAFSLIGFQGATAGMGATEDARLDNSLKYTVSAGPFRAAAAAQLSSAGDNSRQIVQGQVGVDYRAASFDVIFGHSKDAISAAPLPVGFAPTPALLASAGNGLVAGTISDNTGLMLLGSYTAGPVKFYGGYENIRFANPSVPLEAGTSIIGGYSLGTANNAAFNDNRILQVFWTGAKYAVSSDIDLMGAYYQEIQNSFSGNGCADASLASCSGQLYAASLALDWRFAKRWDAYAGVMYSQVDNGLANGFLHRSTVDPTVGARFQF